MRKLAGRGAPAAHHAAVGERLERLRQLDLAQAQIDRLHAPVGLAIGSKTPVEIAVAIMAELTQLRRQQ